MIFAGIGNRWLTDTAKEDLTKYAQVLKELNWKCRSGGAKGSDQVFLDVFGEDCQVLRPHHATHEAREIAGEYHPAWHNCKPYVRNLHGRNSQIILGENLTNKAKFVLCAAADEQKGGTALGIKIARAHHIPVFNVFNKEHGFEEFLETLNNE